MPGDHFSGHAADYARARPTYPPELFRWLGTVAPGRALAWDAGCGNGQASVALAEVFDAVVATDLSPQQLANARPHPRVTYLVGDDHTSHQATASVDLVTVAQAAHWFDMPAFHAEARRVLKPGGVVAIWGYGLTTVSPEIDPQIRHFYAAVVGPFWPPGREHLDNEYRTLPFPLAPVAAPEFAMAVTWDLAAFGDFVGTWSAVQRYRKARGEDPVPALLEALRPLWGAGPRVVRWPLYLRVGRS